MDENEGQGARLKRFEVEGLFGLFDHVIDFNLDDRITIIHAPNGYGKTVILKFIEGFFGGSLSVFRKYEFEKLIFTLSNGVGVSIKQGASDPELFSDRSSEVRHFTISSTYGGEPVDFNPVRDRGVHGDLIRRFGSNSIERYLPIVRAAPGIWKDIATQEEMPLREAIERYWDSLPPSMQRHVQGAHPEWLDRVRSAISCQLIETQRLQVARKTEGNYGRSEAAIVPAVRTYAEHLSDAMGRALEEAASLSQSLDRTFPNRILGRLHGSRSPYSAAQIRERLAELEALRVRLTHVGFLDQPEEDVLIPEGEFDTKTKQILTEYVEDARKKLDVYRHLLVRIELFSEILNSRFQFKSIVFDREHGFVFKDLNGRRLDPSDLSSGEQHELILLYDLIFRSKRNELILIDEPEISLHIAWQKRFLSDLQRITSLSPLDVVLSTHSPQLIGARIDLAVRLKGPKDASAGV